MTEPVLRSELSRARAHLLWCQEALYFWRTTGRDVAIKRREESFLAALSWVWEEQTRASLGDDPYDIGYAKGFHDAEYMECQ